MKSNPTESPTKLKKYAMPVIRSTATDATRAVLLVCTGQFNCGLVNPSWEGCCQPTSATCDDINCI